MLGAFNGNHAFHFTESQVTEGGTTFVHEEVFSGPLAFTVGEGAAARMLGLREKARVGFEGFNEDFKRWIEQGK